MSISFLAALGMTPTLFYRNPESFSYYKKKFTLENEARSLTSAEQNIHRFPSTFCKPASAGERHNLKATKHFGDNRKGFVAFLFRLFPFGQIRYRIYHEF
jgi:hypothetical protein